MRDKGSPGQSKVAKYAKNLATLLWPEESSCCQVQPSRLNFVRCKKVIDSQNVSLHNFQVSKQICWFIFDNTFGWENVGKMRMNTPFNIYFEISEIWYLVQAACIMHTQHVVVFARVAGHCFSPILRYPGSWFVMVNHILTQLEGI